MKEKKRREGKNETKTIMRSGRVPRGHKVAVAVGWYDQSYDMSPRELLVMINWLDLYTVESAALHG